MKASARALISVGAAALALGGLTVAGLTTGLIGTRPGAAVPPTMFTPETYPRVDGSTVTQPLGLAFQRLFTGQNVPDNAVVFSTTDPAYQNLIDGKADLILVTSPSADEQARAAAAGIELEVIPVVNEAFVFLTNADNPVNSLTTDQLRDIYSGKITNWKDVGGPDQPITAYQRTPNSGSQTGMENLVMQGTPMVYAPQLGIYTMSGLVNSIIASFNGSSGSLGYSYYYYVTQMFGDLANAPTLSKIKTMAVDGVAPTAETIRSGDYPLHTAYYMVINKAAPAGSPTRQLVADMLSTAGQQAAMEAGYVPVDPSIPLPTAPAPDPNGLTSLDETYAVNPLTFTTATEYALGARGCASVTRLTVAGLADQARQDDINARFRAVQDRLAGISYIDAAGQPADPATPGAKPAVCPEDTPPIGDDGSWVPPDPSSFDSVTATVGANFANVLSLEAGFQPSQIFPGSAGYSQDALNVRLDTGADLTASAVFTSGANVAGMIQLEAQASDKRCDETCANNKAMAYRANPNQPFDFTSSAATVMGVTIPFAGYWPQVAIFKKFAGAQVAYGQPSPAACPVVTTTWNADFQACLPVDVVAEDWGTVGHVSPEAGSVTLTIPAHDQESWTAFDAGECSVMLRYPSDQRAERGSGVGPGEVALTMKENTLTYSSTWPICVLAVDQTTRRARIGQITVSQDAPPPTLLVSATPGDGDTVTTGLPTFSGQVTTLDGVPYAPPVDVSVNDVSDKIGLALCMTTTDAQGRWSCLPTAPMANGAHQVSVKADGVSNDERPLYGVVALTLSVANPHVPNAPVITSPTAGQHLFLNPTDSSKGSGGQIAVSGTSTPGSTVFLTGDGMWADGAGVVTDETGHWATAVSVSQYSDAHQVTLIATATQADGVSAPSATVSVTPDLRAGYQLAVTADNALADGTATARIEVKRVDAFDYPISAYSGPFTVTATTDDPAVRVLTPSVTSEHSVATVKVAATTPGAHPVTLWVDGQPLPFAVPSAPTIINF